MDPSRFDDLARALNRPASRRLLAGLLGAALAGSLGGAAADAKSKRLRHKRRVTAQKGGNKGNSPTAKSCQKGDWRTLARAGDAAVPFTSEEECVSYGAQGGTLVPLVVNPCDGEPDGTSCSAGVCCDEQCQAGACCPNNAGCSGTTPACTDGTCVCQGNSCGSGQVCSEGTCVACGERGKACCPDDPACQFGAICVDGTCSPCGDRDEPCCNGECSFDYVLCRSGMCVDCGSPGDPCCDVPDSYCGTATCVDGMCFDLGDARGHG